jgi:uncharacterized protein YabE (DUF348 family)
MTPSRLRWIAAVAAVFVLAAGYLSLTRTVTVLVDGEALQLSTRAATVGGALKALSIQLGPQDQVEPASIVPLRNGLIIAVRRAALVRLAADGETYQAVTAEKEPAELLEKWDIELGENDRLVLAGKTIDLKNPLPNGAVLLLEVRRAVPVTLTEDDEVVQFASSALTLGEALAEQGIELRAGDWLQPSADTPLNAALNTTLVRGRELLIEVHGETISLRSAAATVGEALADAGVALQSLDRSQPAEDQPVPEDGEIHIVRVSESVQLSQQSLPHDTEWLPDDSAELDTISVVQEGQDGVQASRVRVRTEDGEEISRLNDSQRTIVEARDQINGYGTKIVIKTATVDGVTIEYYRAVQVYTTWYSPCNSGGSTCLYGTSSGLPVQKGTIATYLNWYRALKFATVYIPGYGPGQIGDVGAWPDRSVPWVDLAFSEADVAGGQPWANQYVTMYFTTPIPSYVPPVWPP